jgi:hypothetical protein
LISTALLKPVQKSSTKTIVNSLGHWSSALAQRMHTHGAGSGK